MEKYNSLLELKDINKWFGKNHVLKDINLKINNNEIIAIIGDNGAGKSTLIKILSGLEKQNQGDILWKGEKKEINSIKDSRNLGIETVFQTQAIVDSLSVARNIFLGREITKRFYFLKILDEILMREKSISLTKRLSLNLKSVDQEMKFCSGGERQGVAISRAMYFKASLTILDEPHTALSSKGIEQVSKFISQLKIDNITVIIIEHNISHAFNIADRFLVMSNGEIKYDINKKETNLKDIETKLLNL